MTQVKTSDFYHSTPDLKEKRCINISVTINGVQHKMELDTGCETFILSAEFWKNSLHSPKPYPSSITFRTYTKKTFKPKSKLNTTIVYNSQVLQDMFPVSNGTSLFGRELLHKFQID